MWMSDKSIPTGYENFCSAPWSTIYIEPSGAVGPCCIIQRPADTYGNLNESSFTDIVNGEKLKSFRKKFLNNERPPECNTCWKHEENENHESLRGMFNRVYFEPEFINDTSSNGDYENLDIKYWDIRPNNLCNLGCIMCCADLSSGYQQLLIDLDMKADETDSHPMDTVKFRKVSNDSFDDLMSHVKRQVKNSPEYHFYFAGGEPLIIPQHKQIMDYFVEQKMFDIPIRYNTNLTTLHYKGVDWIEVWKKFNDITVEVSLDASGPAGEFQRFGSDWNIVKSNIRKLVENGMHVRFNVVITMITYDTVLDTIAQLEEIIPREKLINRISLYATNTPSQLVLRRIPTQYLDISIIDKLKEMGYNTLLIENHLNDTTELTEFGRDWMITLIDRMKQDKGKDINDILPWFEEYKKTFIND